MRRQTHTHTQTQTHTHTHAHPRTRTHTHTHARRDTLTILIIDIYSIYLYIFIFYIYIYIYSYIYIYIYITCINAYLHAYLCRYIDTCGTRQLAAVDVHPQHMFTLLTTRYGSPINIGWYISAVTCFVQCGVPHTCMTSSKGIKKSNQTTCQHVLCSKQ